MKKIPLIKISKKIYEKKGIAAGPFSDCLACKCGRRGRGGACCENGVYADKESYDLIIKHRAVLEKRVGLKLEKCFDRGYAKDTEFLGNKAIGTRVRNNTCVFRSSQGCEIVKLVIEKKLSKRMIPSGCRLYPITWDKGRLFLERIRKNCVYSAAGDKVKKTFYDIFKDDINDIFVFHE